MDKKDSWITSMLALGYVQGPEFSSYQELSVWDGLNTRPHVRRFIGDKFRVYFTDYRSDTQYTPVASDSSGSFYDINKVPF